MDDSVEALRGPSEMDEVYLSEDAGADVAQDVGDNGEDPDVQMADDDEAERDHIAAEDGDTEQAQEPTEQDPQAEEEDAEEEDTEAGEQQEGGGRRDNVLEISQDEVRAVSVLGQLLTGVADVNMNLIAPFAPEDLRSGLGALCEEYGVQIPSAALDGLHRALLPLVTRLHAMKQRIMISREQEEACPVDVKAMLQRIIREHDGPMEAAPADAAASAASPSAPPASGAASEPASAPEAAATAAASSNAASSSTAAAPAAARAMPMLPSRPARRTAASARAANPAASGPVAPVQGDSLEAVYGAEEDAKTKAKRRELQDMRVCVNLLAQRLGVPLNGSFLHQVINRINVAENIKFPPSSNHRGHVEHVMRLATAEAEEKLAELPPSEPIPGFEVTVLVLGMTGVGKTMMINRLLGREPMAGVDAFGCGTQSVKVIRGVIRGVQFKFIDTPGLSTCSSAVGSNQRKLVAVKRMLRSNPADTMLFVDRIDAHRRSNPEQAVLSMVLEVLGKPLLYRSCMVLTHGASAPPETPNGQMSYELWSQQSVHRMQMTLRQATHDPRIMVPVMPVENHPNCRTNAAGEPVLPNGMAWRTQLLVVCCGSKVLEKTEKVVMMTSRKKAPASASVNLPPIPWILGQMSQGKPPKKLPEEERDIVDLEAIKKMPHDEGREAKRRRQEFVRQRREEEQSAGDEQVLIPAPDPPVPPTFDGAPTLHRYRYLESGAGWVVRPFVEQQSMDHDDGVHGAHVERQYTLRRRGQYLGGVPGHFLMQIQKDKDHTMLVVDTESSAFTSRNGCVSLASNAQTLGSDMAYTLRLEPRWKYHPRAKSSAGLIWSRLGENRSLLKGIVANGFRLEQRIRIKSGVKLLGTFSRIGYRRKHAPMMMPGLMGMMGSMGGKKGEVGWSTGLELHCKAGKGANDPSVVAGLSLMMWRRSLNLGLNLAGQCDVTPETIGTCRLTINNRSQGSLTLRVTSHDKPQLGWGMLVPALGFLGQKLLNRGELVL